MKDVILIAGAVALGWWLRGCKEKARRLTEENAVLMAKVREASNKETN